MPQRGNGPGLVALLLLAVVVGAPTGVSAGPFDVYGFGSRGIAMGGAMTAISDDHTAVFYNPGNLTLRKKIHLGGEFLISFPSLNIRQDSPDTGPTPIEADGFAGIGLGVLFPLGGKVEYRLAFGLAIYLPTDQLLRLDALDPLIPRWYLYESLADKLQVLFGFGAQITDWMSVGAGFQTLASLTGGTEVEADLINQTITSRYLLVDIVNTFGPIAGLHLGPFMGLNFGFSWRSEIDVDFDIPIEVDLGRGLEVLLVARGAALYTPHTLSFGLAYEFPDMSWLWSFDARYALWSHAPDPTFFFAVDFEGDLLDGLGASDTLDLRPGPSGLASFSDIVSLHLGTEVWLHEFVVGRLGYQFRPSPLPEQTGLTNYIDNDSHTISAGLGVTFPDPLNLDDEPGTIEISASYALLPDERTEKASSVDPVGSYNHGGEILTFSFTIRHDF